MELSAIPEIIEADVEKLREAGVPSVEALAVWPELPPLAERAGLELERVESYRDAARGRIERALAEAGVAEPSALAVADLSELAQRTGVELVYLQHYQAKAREALGKVVIAEGAPVARVQLMDRSHDAVPVVPLMFGEAEDAALARATGDAVVLRPGAEVALALIGGVTHRALPLYKERRREGGEVEELRVRVVDVREVGATPSEPPKKTSGIGRLFSRKK